MFLGAKDQILIGDFGIAKAIAKGELAKSTVGTPYYIAPEVIKVISSYVRVKNIP